jgi:transposase
METPSLGKDGATMSNKPSPRKYPPELHERAVRMVHETIEQRGERFGVVTEVARKLGVGVESLRNWVAQAEVDGGTRPGVTTEERRRIAELERENRELRRANEILRAASAFFARELDPRPPR